MVVLRVSPRVIYWGEVVAFVVRVGVLHLFGLFIGRVNYGLFNSSVFVIWCSLSWVGRGMCVDGRCGAIGWCCCHGGGGFYWMG